VGAAALALGMPSAAWAHVGVNGTSTAAGSSTLLTFAFSHGCGDSPTTKVAIQIPDGINAVAPTVNPGWTTEKVMAALDTPIKDSHGNEVTERVAQVVYTAKEPIANGLRDAFVLSLTLPEDAAGTTLAFPTVQSCEVGENAWVEIPAEGQDPHDLDSPAPTLTVTEAVESEHGHGHGESASPSPGTEHSDTTGSSEQHDGGHTPSGDAGPSPLVIVSLVVGALGLITGGIALAQGRKKA
jgi:uncharacterized protein YcnI